MSFLLRFLGIDAASASKEGHQTGTTGLSEIATQLDGYEPKHARFLAAFAYVLARVAAADLEIDRSEVAEMQRIVEALADLAEDEASLVVTMATAEAVEKGGTQNYLVTRELRSVSTREQRTKLLHCLFAVGAADGSISAAEGNEISAIAEELGFMPAEANAVKGLFRDKLATLRGLPGRK